MTTPRLAPRKTRIHDTQAMDRAIAPDPKRRWLRIAIVVGVVLVAGLGIHSLLDRWGDADRSIDRARLRTGVVTHGELRYEIAVQGRVVAASRPTLFAPSDGLVELEVREGEAVAGDQILARIDSPELANQLQQERATHQGLASEVGRLELAIRQQNQADAQAVELLEVRVAAAARGLERAERLHEDGLLNALDLEAARDELTIQTLELEQARRNQTLQQEMRSFELADAEARRDRQALVVEETERRFDELAIRSPFDGLVATVEVENRDAVVTGQPLLGVVDLEDLEVEINIPEAYADEVVPGLPAVVQMGTGSLEGTVTRVAPEVRSGQVEGRVAFDQGTPPGLRQNQRLSTRVVLDHRPSALKVPRGQWLEAGGARTVWVVEDDLARRREIEVGAVSVTEVEILSGLEEGEEIILSDVGPTEEGETLLLRD